MNLTTTEKAIIIGAAIGLTIRLAAAGDDPMLAFDPYWIPLIGRIHLF